MRARSIILASVASVAIVGIGWEIGVQHTVTEPAAGATGTAVQSATSQSTASAGGSAPTGSAATPSATAPNGDPSTTPAPSASSPSAAASAATQASDGTFTGSVERTPFGDVQVSVTISAGQIADVKPLQLTSEGGRSVQISDQAAPVLRSEVLKAQSAKVDSVSGATYTSEGYLGSLQAALDAAHFG